MKIDPTTLDKITKMIDEDGDTGDFTKEEEAIFILLNEKIFSVYYGDIEDEDFYVFEKDYIDAINSQGCLHITINNTKYICVVRDGNMDGSVIEQFSENAEYEPPIQYKHSFQLDIDWHKGLDSKKKRFATNLFNAMNKKIQKKCGEYIYDRRVSPTNKIENYYRDYMRKNHLVLISEEVSR